jgi:hypothetical protein
MKDLRAGFILKYKNFNDSNTNSKSEALPSTFLKSAGQITKMQNSKPNKPSP